MDKDKEANKDQDNRAVSRKRNDKETERKRKMKEEMQQNCDNNMLALIIWSLL